MNPWLGLLCGLVPVVFWASLGCYSLRDFAYSRLEALCERRGRPERFRSILTQQDPATLVLELVVTLGVLGLGGCLALWLGGPAMLRPVPVAVCLLQYATAVLLAWLLFDLLPWTLGQVIGEVYLDFHWPLIQLLVALFSPLLVVVRWADRLTHRIVGRGEPEIDDASVIDEEIRTVVDEGRREGVLPSDAGVMIERVMELQDEDVGAIMTPRTDMLWIQVDASLEEARRELLDGGHSRMPVIGDSTDDILGILYAKDLLKALEPNRRAGELVPVLRDIIREPVHVPITTQIPSLLELMKKRHVQIAIVMDEHGGVAGLVTMEDILEEIVGEIEDEYDEDMIRQRILVIDERMAEVDARVHLDDLNERFAYGLPEDQEFDTIGGFVFSLAGRVPVVGETIVFQNLAFTVLGAENRRVTRVRIEVIEPSNVAGDSESTV